MKTAKSQQRSIEEIIWAAQWITHLKVLKYVEDNSYQPSQQRNCWHI